MSNKTVPYLRPFRPPTFAYQSILPMRNSAFLAVGLPTSKQVGPQRVCHVPQETDTPGLGALYIAGTVVRTRRPDSPGRQLSPHSDRLLFSRWYYPYRRKC